MLLFQMFLLVTVFIRNGSADCSFMTHVLIQPLFKALSKLWSGLQDEAELMNVFTNLALNLRPFLDSQAEMFSDMYLDRMLEGSEVKTDEQRLSESSGGADITDNNSVQVQYVLRPVVVLHYC